MPTLIRLEEASARLADDSFTVLADEDGLVDSDIVVSLGRLLEASDSLFATNRKVGVRIEADQEVERLAPYIERLALIELVFPKYRDGRAYSSARLLRERFGYRGELRAVGDVLREQAGIMVRCGIDAFEPADNSTPEEWTAAAHRYRHVYQRASDHRTPVFVERGS